uniref:SWIM-type domain-containing protein n=1 Tax=Panagrolaimus sp. ES5 TaxID=591445 RepID=A0AC34G018_9BILA
MPAQAFVPGMKEIANYIRDKSTLPLMPGMQPTGPMTPYMGTENPNVSNAMARELVERKRVEQSSRDERHFMVHDMSDKLFGVVVKDKNLSNKNYECNCHSKNCIHLRAVFLFLGIPPSEIPFIRNTDPLRSLHGNRNKDEKQAGNKAPRKKETYKDYESEEEVPTDHDFASLDRYSKDTVESTSQKSKRKSQSQSLESGDFSQGSQIKRRRRQPETAKPDIAKMWSEIQANPDATLNEAELQIRRDVAER